MKKSDKSVKAEINVMSTRKLWETIFDKDTKKFLDYYYREKEPQNITLTIEDEEEISAMLHLTPYKTIIGGNRFETIEDVCYIVGVATAEPFRHRGYMKRLLAKAFEILYKKDQPFVFLMPADPAIYRSFQFVYIYEKPDFSLAEDALSESTITRLLKSIEQEGEKNPFRDNPAITVLTRNKKPLQLSVASEHDLEELAGFTNAYLKARYEVYLRRDVPYLSTLKKELKSQNGDIFLWKDNENIAGYFLYAREELECIQESILSDEYREYGLIQVTKELKPLIMARIISVVKMLSFMRSPYNVMLTFKINDPIITENNGFYVCKVMEECTDVKKTIIKRVEGKASYDCEVTVDMLALFLFGQKTAEECFPDAADEVCSKLKLVICLNGTFFNEIV